MDDLNPSAYLSYKSAAKLLDVPIGTLYSLVSQQRIPHLRLGNRMVRFSKKDLLEWLEQHKVNDIKDSKKMKGFRNENK